MTLLLPSLLTLLAVSPDANAADFSGRIRRIRIREASDNSSFRTIVQTESGDPTDPGSLEVTVTGLDTGKEITLSGTAKKTRVLATATGSFSKVRPIETKYTMTAQMRGVQDPTLTYDWSVELERCTADCAWTEEVLKDGTVAGVKLTVTEEADGSESFSAQLRLVPGDQVTWTSTSSLELSTPDEDGDGVPDETAKGDLGAGPVYRTRWATPSRYTFDDSAGQDSSVGILAVLTNPDGSTDSFADFAVLDLNGETGLAEATIKARKKGGYKVNLWTQATADVPVGSVFVEVSDSDSDEVLGELDIDAAVETTAILTAALPSTLVEGEKVAAAVVLYSGEEKVVSENLTFVLAEGTLSATFTEGGTVSLYKAGVYLADDGTYELSFSVVGSDAELVDSGFVDVSARTTAGSVDATVETLWQRWTAVLDTDSAPETFGFDAEVRDSEGVSVDGWVFELQAQFGTGTRSTASSAGSKPELL